MIDSITAQSKDQHGVLVTEGRLFFPSGIEPISLKFKVRSAFDIHFQVLGKDAPSTDDPATLVGVDEHPGEGDSTS